METDVRNEAEHQAALEKLARNFYHKMLSMHEAVDELIKEINVDKDSDEENTGFKLVPFWKTRSKAWFNHVEFVMQRRKMTTDVEKYEAVLYALDLETLEKISDIMVDCPQINKYAYLKENLIERFTKLYTRSRKSI